MNFREAAQEIGISTEAYTRLYALFIESTEEDLRSLKSAEERGDREKIASLAHHIKGAASNMEFNTLMEEARRLESSAAEAGEEEISSRIEKINGEFRAITDAWEVR